MQFGRGQRRTSSTILIESFDLLIDRAERVTYVLKVVVLAANHAVDNLCEARMSTKATKRFVNGLMP